MKAAIYYCIFFMQKLSKLQIVNVIQLQVIFGSASINTVIRQFFLFLFCTALRLKHFIQDEFVLPSSSNQKSNLSLYSLYYAKACNGFAGHIFESMRLGNTALFEEISQRWRAVRNTLSGLTGPNFELQMRTCYCSTNWPEVMKATIFVEGLLGSNFARTFVIRI